MIKDNFERVVLNIFAAAMSRFATVKDADVEHLLHYSMSWDNIIIPRLCM